VCVSGRMRKSKRTRDRTWMICSIGERLKIDVRGITGIRPIRNIPIVLFKLRSKLVSDIARDQGKKAAVKFRGPSDTSYGEAQWDKWKRGEIYI
jgi:hypothetical protein